MSDILSRDIKYLPGVGPKRAEILEKELGITTFRDLLYTFPFRYIDKSRIYAIKELEPSMAFVQIRGKVQMMNIVGERHGKRLVVTVSDTTGKLDLVFFQGIKWAQERFRIGQEYIIFGKPSSFNGSINIVHPEVETLDEAASSAFGNGLTGIYSSTDRLRNSGISNKAFVKLQFNALKLSLDCLEETLPEYILKANGLCPLKYALKNIHFPKDLNALNTARYRLKFDELFFLQLSLLKQKGKRTREAKGYVFSKVGEYFNNCYKQLPYDLTGAQKRVIREIRHDMGSGIQMNRLLQGDVGSGKTMVSLLCCLIAADNGYQSVIMAPTEVLATQHYQSISEQCDRIGIRTALLTGSTKASLRKEIDAGLQDGSIQILIGTHAVIEDKVVFRNLGFVVIDEQHRFGVEQRARLRLKSAIAPHVLVMTATPIPRTLAMTVFGDLDVSVIDELPPGRKPIQTIHATESQRDKVYAFIKKEIAAGRQVFIVYPLIKESQAMDYKNLEEGYEQITRVFPAPQYITAVVHGQQKNEDKNYDMKLFAEGKAHILVATSVIEVGVNVPNASVMLIESAERFGLSQLHQLRGRVGRGADKAYCILMTGYKLSADSAKRIDLMCSTNDGFELAEADMKMRGPGDMDGTQQSGLALDLHISNLSKDSEILTHCRNVALSILEKDPLLQLPENRLLVINLDLAARREQQSVKGIEYSKIS